MKKICITFLTIQLLIFGSSTTLAQSPTILEENFISSENADETQIIDHSVKQDQNVNTGGTAIDIQQEQDVQVIRSQEQSAPHDEMTRIDSEEKVDGSIDNTGDSKFETGPSLGPNKSYNQEQSVEIVAEQTQKIIEADKVDANQEQDIFIDYSQSLKLTQTEDKRQQSKIVTAQDQSMSTSNLTDYVEQLIGTRINTKQKNETNLAVNDNNATQETSVMTIQQHKAETSGSATIQQEQSVEAIATNENTSSENLSIKAKASNGVEIIKETVQTIVRVVQSIFIDDQKVGDFNKEFIIGEDPIQETQEYSQTFAWGTLYVLNHALINKTEDNDIASLLDSIIRLEYFLHINKPIDGDNSQGSNDNEESNEGENSTENDHQNSDSGGEVDQGPADHSDGNDLQNPDKEEGSNDEEKSVGNDQQNSDSGGEVDQGPTDHSEGNDLQNPDKEEGSNDEEKSVGNDHQNPDSSEEVGSDPEDHSVKDDSSIPNKEEGTSNEEGQVDNNPQNVDLVGIKGTNKEKFSIAKPISLYWNRKGILNKWKKSAVKNEFYCDTDGDRVPDYLEVHKFYTNPLKADTDEDGLTDYFEIIYHSSTSFYFSLEEMVYEPALIIDDLKEKWKVEPDKLNPLNKDSDYDGITDDLENFDQDEFDNKQEQLHDTNPYKKDDPSIHYGSFVE